MTNEIKHKVETPGERLDKYLAQVKIATSRSESLRWIEDGFVAVNGQGGKPSYVVKTGDDIVIHKPSLKTLDLTPQKLDFEILFEDKDILVLNKPAGLVVHPGAGHYETSLVHGLLHHCKDELSGIGGVERPGIVHRLDKGTSGLMVVAKSDKAHVDLSHQFQNHEVVKEYRALVLGTIEKSEQTLVHLMKRSEINRKKFVVNQKRGKQAITHVTVLQKNKRVSDVSVLIETGRTHQIRVHLSFIGHPIVGDETYGGTKKLNTFDEDEKKFIRDLNRPLLHSYALSFRHPLTEKELHFTAPLPPDFEAARARFLA
jgi:23S rRNA pseudouridine1911/1915/1917 synthase